MTTPTPLTVHTLATARDMIATLRAQLAAATARAEIAEHRCAVADDERTRLESALAELCETVQGITRERDEARREQDLAERAYVATAKDLDELRKAIAVLPGCDNPRSPQDIMDVAAALAQCERERDNASRVCDQPGCIAVVIKREATGHRECAKGHASRWCEKTDLDAAQARVAQLTEALAPFARWPVVYDFALVMIGKLDYHKHKKGGREGWTNDSPDSLARRVLEEADALTRSVVGFGPSKQVLGDAADVANMAMMVADVSSTLCLETAPVLALATDSSAAWLEAKVSEARAAACGCNCHVEGSGVEKHADCAACREALDEEQEDYEARLIAKVRAATLEEAAQLVIARGFRIPSLAKLSDQIRSLCDAVKSTTEPVSPLKAIADSMRDGTFRGVSPAVKPCRKCAFEGVDPEQCEANPCACACHASTPPAKETT